MCTRDDYHQAEDIESEGTETKGTENELPNETGIYDPGPSSLKRPNIHTNDEDVQKQVESVELLARVLQDRLDGEVDISPTGVVDDNNDSEAKAEPKPEMCFLKIIAKWF